MDSLYDTQDILITTGFVSAISTLQTLHYIQQSFIFIMNKQAVILTTQRASSVTDEQLTVEVSDIKPEENLKIHKTEHIVLLLFSSH